MTVLQLPSLAEVQQYARGALRAADATDTVPVPLDDVIEAVELHPAETLFLFGENTPPRIRKILDKIKLAKKALGLFDQNERQIYVDTTLAVPKRRFVIGHETGHAVLPWHKAAYMGDDDTTIAPDTREGLEQEANAFSAELLSGGGGFIRRADDYAPGIGPALELAQQYDMSFHAALRHYAGSTKHQVALLVLGRHRVQADEGSRGLKVMTAQCAQSDNFLHRYGPVSDLIRLHARADLGDAVTLADQTSLGDGVRAATLTLADRQRGGSVQFDAEVFCNGYLKFVLLYRRPWLPGPRVRVMPN